MSGQEFSFDAVVQEPLGNDLASRQQRLKNPSKPMGFVTPTTVDLELLSAGGHFQSWSRPTYG